MDRLSMRGGKEGMDWVDSALVEIPKMHLFAYLLER
jgi:hypothetical protein